MRTPLWLLPNVLSLDAPVIAVVWQSFFAAVFGTPITIAARVSLGLAVWAIYIADRLLDVGKADALGRAAVLMGDPKRVNTDVAKLQAVSAADVQRVMKKYFSDNNRVVINYQAEPAKEKAGASQSGKKEGGVR